ncbi:MAG: phosphate ABC transporter substrate-binding protein [Hyphomonas sp.]|uniref:substrate-binding domain-containing protein n=1 Tax=Hyphomonas sp. UBA3601 TaxID=1946626 RepID=UPI000C66528D|nr:substrate-binding domain-containing protein [Hyphomonas sp. UBA3601]MBG68286.1 phosphate ABC transporter substrate-binding protein [Hyphomonas sp.]
MTARIGSILFPLVLLFSAACGRTDLSDLDTGDTIPPPPVSADGTHKIRIVGSSTVAPFATTVAERFGATTRYPTPIVETTGTGGGFKTFCQKIGPDRPSISDASRMITESEQALCAENGITEITALSVGFDGIVLANARQAPTLDLTKEEVFLALAAHIPDGQGGFRPNPYKNWSEISPDLPDEPIMVLGPPPTSGTRDAFTELGMEQGALALPELVALKQADPAAFRLRTHTIRTDGAWIDLGENDTAIIQSLIKTPTAVGVLGYSFLEQNGDRVKAAHLDGVPVTFEAIASGEYGLSRSMYIYVKNQNIPLVPGLTEFVQEFVSDRAMGPDGYLLEKGLIPLPDELRIAEQEVARQLETRGARE